MRLWILSLILFVPAAAVIVDRIAISIGNKVITDSEIDDRIRLTAFQNGEQPGFGAESRKIAAQRLIDQKLVEREMDVGRYPRLDDRQKNALLVSYQNEHYKTEADFRAALEQYGLTPDDIQHDLARQADLLSFLNLRFRPAVQVTAEDVRQYFREKILPRASSADPVSLNEVRTQIEEQLTNERADKELDAWLSDQRKRVRIEYHEEELR